jgi:glutamine cyclotransferase
MTTIRFIRLLVTAAAMAVMFASGACSDSTSLQPRPGPPDTSITTYGYNVIQQFPHDAAAFTQGLVYVDTVFIEGTGLLGQSTLRRVVPATGQVIQNHDLPSNWFGEGVAVWGDTIVQLTWRNHVATVYHKDSFAEIDTFTYTTEGWGLTHDGARFIMSDGSSTLYFRDRSTFAETGRVTVFDDKGPVDELNELEYIDGYVYANRYRTATILIIDPVTGRVRGRINTSGLEHTSSNVTNGIAYDADNDRLFITGKRWRNVYEIELVEQPADEF